MSSVTLLSIGLHGERASLLLFLNHGKMPCDHICINMFDSCLSDLSCLMGRYLGWDLNSSPAPFLGSAPGPVAEAQADSKAHTYNSTGRHLSEVDFNIRLHSTVTAAGNPVKLHSSGMT